MNTRLMFAIALLAMALTTTAAAQRRGGGNPQVTQAIEALGSDDPTAVRGAIETLGISGDARGALPIAERVRSGLPPDLLDAALDALLVLGRPEAGPVLFELLGHRRATVRLRAVNAIVAARPRGADRALAEALGDGDAAVRAAAAEGLGTIGATSSIDTLFHALERRVDGAAVAIGKLARPEDVERFLGLLGQIPFDVATPALLEMLNRNELAERARLSIVHRLSELATPEVRVFLESWVSSLPEGENSAVRRAATDAASRIAQ